MLFCSFFLLTNLENALENVYYSGQKKQQQKKKKKKKWDFA